MEKDLSLMFLSFFFSSLAKKQLALHGITSFLHQRLRNLKSLLSDNSVSLTLLF